MSSEVCDEVHVSMCESEWDNVSGCNAAFMASLLDDKTKGHRLKG